MFEPPPILLKDHTAAELHARLAPLGVDARTARRIHAAVVKRGLAAVSDFPDVSPRLTQRVRAATVVPRLTLMEKVVSEKDGFAKYLFRSEEGKPQATHPSPSNSGPAPRSSLPLPQGERGVTGRGDAASRPADAGRSPDDSPSASPSLRVSASGLFEAVRIPLLHRPGDEKYVVCVSSQVGCALACAFCQTGRLGFVRNLETWEIVDQVLQIRADSAHPVRGVVFMGMGEPFLNYDRVLRAAEILGEPSGAAIDAKAITISTAGVVPGISRFTAERRPYRLVVSLASADPRKRRELMPIERTHPTADVIDALREYHAATGRRVTIAWPLLAGVNTGSDEAEKLAELTAGLPMMLDIIDVNDPAELFHPPEAAELAAFRDALRAKLKMPVVRRYSGGGDIAGGCGMLAGRAAGGSP